MAFRTLSTWAAFFLVSSLVVGCSDSSELPKQEMIRELSQKMERRPPRGSFKGVKSLTNSPLNLTVFCEDSSGCSGIEIKGHSGLLQTVAADFSHATLSIQEEGQHQITATLKDLWGNKTLVTSPPFVVDRSGPKITLQSSAKIEKNTASFSISCADRWSKCDRVTIYRTQHVDPTLYKNKTPGRSLPIKSMIWNQKKEMSYTERMEGDWIYTAEAIDAAGNAKTSSPVRLIVDRTAPKIEIVTDDKSLPGFRAVTIKCTDTISRCQAIRYSLDEQKLSGNTPRSDSSLVSLTLEKTSRVKAQAIDRAGNWSQVFIKKVSVIPSTGQRKPASR